MIRTSPLLLLLTVSSAAQAQWSFTVVANGNTPVPGGPGQFSYFNAPSIRDGHVLFTPSTVNPFGVYDYSRASATISMVANLSTPVPGGSSNFAVYRLISFDGDHRTWAGGGGDTGGIYTAGSAGVVANVDNHMTVPGTSSTFGAFGANPGQLSRSGDSIGFLGGTTPGTNEGLPGAYAWHSGSLSRLADTSTPAPGGGTFSGFRSITVGAETATFVARLSGSHSDGLYQAPVSGGPVTTLLAPGGTLPGATLPFQNITPLSSSGGNVAFLAGSSLEGGVYAFLDGTLTRIVDKTSLAPEGGLFTDFLGYVAISGRNILFEATANGSEGLYFWRDGSLSRITGDIDPSGQLVTSWGVGPESVEGDTVAFSVTHLGTPGALYTATYIPAPGALALLAAAGLLAPRRRRT